MSAQWWAGRQAGRQAGSHLLTGRSRRATAACCSRGLTSGESVSLSARHSACTHLQQRATRGGGRGGALRGGAGPLGQTDVRNPGFQSRPNHSRNACLLGGSGVVAPGGAAAAAAAVAAVCAGRCAGTGPYRTCTAARTQTPAGCPWCPSAPGLQEEHMPYKHRENYCFRVLNTRKKLPYKR